MSQTDAWAPILPIMERHGVRCTPQEFHAAVNVAFHQNESQVYDELHADMWESLPREFGILAADCLAAGAPASTDIHMLDIGCGTGLASDSLLKSKLGPRIRQITLLDTSSAMLQRARARAEGWGVPFTIHEGLLNTLPPQPYDLIVTCSVLHHVPDVSAFLRDVKDRQSPGGVFMHLQDPNGETVNSITLAARRRQVATDLPEWMQRLAPSRILGRLYRELTGNQGEDYISKTNRELIRLGVLTNPLTVRELFSITDIHVQDGEGISIRGISPFMSAYALISQTYYGYFGALASTLPARLRREEDSLSAKRDPDGMFLAAAWKLSLSPELR